MSSRVSVGLPSGSALGMWEPPAVQMQGRQAVRSSVKCDSVRWGVGIYRPLGAGPGLWRPPGGHLIPLPQL